MEYEILKEFFSPCAGDMFPLSQEITEQEVANPEQYVRDLFKNEKDPQFIVSKNGENTRKYLAWTEELLRLHGIRRITPRRGDVYTFGGGEVHVLREPDPQITANCINNSSLVFRLDTAEHRVLFLGDLGEEGGRQLLAQTPPEELHSDYVQMAHHGQNGVEKAVYEAIQPRCCLWCTPTWLWDNLGPYGYDSGIFNTVVVRGWMSEMGARRHYVNMNGPHAIAL